MFVRIVRESFLRRKRRKAIVLAAVALGTAAATALLDIALDIGDKMNGELKAFGANLVVLPAGGGSPVVIGGEDVTGLRLPATLDAASIVKVKDNFWKNNILEFAPALDVPARLRGRAVLLRGTWFDRPVVLDPAAGEEPVRAGLRRLNPYWSVQGLWPEEGARASPGAVVGRVLAGRLGLRPGDRIDIEVSGRPAALEVAGILSAGGEEDEAVLVPIETAWRLSGLSGRVSRILLRALTTPESVVYERLGKNVRDLPPAEFERWSCTPFVSSIAYELEKAVPGAEARVIRRVADSEGAILRRTSALMALVAAMAAIASALTVTSALTTGVLERRSEIGLLKALGAGAPWPGSSRPRSSDLPSPSGRWRSLWRSRSRS